MVNTLGVDNEAKQTIEALQAELKKTKERLQAVEELKGQAGMQSHLTLFVVFMILWISILIYCRIPKLVYCFCLL
jgi:ABC-type Fe3+-hydroxamate transport system substrate-binding protein